MSHSLAIVNLNFLVAAHGKKKEGRAVVRLTFLPPELTEKLCPDSQIQLFVIGSPQFGMWLCTSSDRFMSLLSKWSVSCLSQGQCLLFLDSPAGLAASGKQEVGMWGGREMEPSVSNPSFFLPQHVCWMWELAGAVQNSVQRQVGYTGRQSGLGVLVTRKCLWLAGVQAGPRDCRFDPRYQSKENWNCC